MNSYFGSLNYNWSEKYFVDLSFRRDGSSQFAPGHRWGTFWSAGALWNMKKENFLKNVKWLNELNIHIDYGTAGNNGGVGNYGYLGTIGRGTAYNTESTLGVGSPSNTELTWEKTAQFNVGTMFRIFDRATFNVDYYSKKTTDMLMDIPYSYTTGFESGPGNIGALTNKGVDVKVEVDAIKTKDWHWSVRANLNYNKNKITELFAGRDEYIVANTGLKLEVGKPYGEFYYVNYAGVDPRDGKPMWYTKEGNLTKTYNEERDAVFTGKQRYAPISGGFGTSLRWKDLTISADFVWQAKKYMINNDNYFVKNANFGTNYNQATDMLNVWTKPGQVTDIPAYGEEIQFDSHLLENASFLRMKNLTIQYLLPKKICQATKFFETVKVFGVARNLFTITKFSGYDPEPDINLVKFNYPNTRQFVFGVEVSF
jgi:TonB-linked SusC/RagA family outer membrane protein